MRRFFLAGCLTLAAAPGFSQTAAPPAATAIDVGGVKYDPTITLGGARLQLNGAGVRYRFAFRVYTAGLYLGAKAASPEAVYAATGPRRLHVVMLRDIDANELGRLFTDGMQKNATREEFMKVIPGTVRLGEIFAARKRLASGDSFSVDHLPGTGTVILVNGKPTAEPIREPEFFGALMKIWLGPKPADGPLKDALLGLQREAPRANEP